MSLDIQPKTSGDVITSADFNAIVSAVNANETAINGKQDTEEGKGLSSNDFTDEEKEKLSGIEAGAEVNTVSSVAGKTGAVTLDKNDVGLGNVDNTSDANKPISTATQTALDGKASTSSVSSIEAKIPNQASAQNQLADKDFVNSSVATNTANYISNNGEPFTNVAQLEAYSGTVTNNDYAFVTGTDSDGNTYYDRYKATVSGNTVSWAKEFRLNNSSFTAAQWSAINSGITDVLVGKLNNIDLSQYYTKSETNNLLGDKVDKVSGKGLSTNDFTDNDKTKLDSAYQKPQDGIPKTDLTEDVQDSLDNADTALQEEQALALLCPKTETESLVITDAINHDTIDYTIYGNTGGVGDRVGTGAWSYVGTQPLWSNTDNGIVYPARNSSINLWFTHDNEYNDTMSLEVVVRIRAGEIASGNECRFDIFSNVNPDGAYTLCLFKGGYIYANIIQTDSVPEEYKTNATYTTGHIYTVTGKINQLRRTFLLSVYDETSGTLIVDDFSVPYKHNHSNYNSGQKIGLRSIRFFSQRGNVPDEYALSSIYITAKSVWGEDAPILLFDEDFSSSNYLSKTTYGTYGGKYRIPVKVSGLNLVNTTEFEGSYNEGSVINADNGTFTIRGRNLYDVNTSGKLHEAILNRLEVGKTYYAKWDIVSGTPEYNFLYVYGGSNNTWYNGQTHTITQAEKDSANGICIYGSWDSSSQISPEDVIYSNFIISEVSTPFEPYVEPSIVNIYLDEPLDSGESISLSDTNVQVQLSQSVTNNIEVGTSVQPSKVKIKYYQDINKIVANLQALILNQ